MQASGNTGERVVYLTHPQVQIDPSVPVPAWGLNEVGRQRVQMLASSQTLSGTTTIVSSAERKAIETAEPLAAALGVALEIRGAMHENDRAATGFLSPVEFETVADRFFACPHDSVRGWERAIDAQERIVREVEIVLARDVPSDLSGDVLFVGHGAVGTLLYCHLAGIEINRGQDQPAGGGNYFSFRKRDRRMLHAWRRMEETPD
jgi:broad specificity phosphatase PhoE